MLKMTRVSADTPAFPALKSAPVETEDAGTVRLGSGCITGQLPPVRRAAKAALVAALLALAACQNGVPIIPPAAQPAGSTQAAGDPAIVAKINYVCAYSGLFKFANTAAASVVPVPGAALAASLVNGGVDNACLHPETVAGGIGAVENLISQFKSAGKM